MSRQWERCDGKKIKIVFDKPLIGDIEGNEEHFEIIVPEYDYVPYGHIQNISKTINNITMIQDDKNQTLMIELSDTERCCNAVSNIIVKYDGLGTLEGTEGKVLAFEKDFAPQELVFKGNQNDNEYIKISNVITTGVLTPIHYQNYKQEDHYIKISNTVATGILTSI